MNKHIKPTWLELLLVKKGAIISDSHLVLTSGLHSDGYVNLRVLAGDTIELQKIGKDIATEITRHEIEIAPTIRKKDAAKEILIFGPETLGRTLAEFTAMAGLFNFAWCNMGKDKDGNGFAAWNQKMSFQEIVTRSRCYIVDDLLTTAKSIKLTKSLIEDIGGKVEGAVVVARRDEAVTAETIGIPWLHALVEISGFDTYEADSCPRCAAKVPMRLRPGHGYEWIINNPNYPVG